MRMCGQRLSERSLGADSGRSLCEGVRCDS